MLLPCTVLLNPHCGLRQRCSSVSNRHPIDMATFPLNAWYAAAYDVELKAALLPRTVCNRRLVMFRRKVEIAKTVADPAR